jgi:hypothetical protein
LTVVATVFLAQNVFGNLYEQNAALRSLVDPTPGALIGELELGSPLYYYMPWVLIGLVSLSGWSSGCTDCTFAPLGGERWPSFFSPSVRSRRRR